MLLAAGGKAHLTGRMAKKGSAHPGGDLLVPACITGIEGGGYKVAWATC